MKLLHLLLRRIIHLSFKNPKTLFEFVYRSSSIRRPYILILYSNLLQFSSQKMYNRKPMEKKKEGIKSIDSDMSFRQIMKDVELFGSSHMTWKDKKALENKKVTDLGGKPQKKQRLPLSVARVQMKKQKEREDKMSEQNMILGRFGGQFGSGSRRKPTERKRMQQERVLKSTVGNFRGGVLDVRHLLHSGSSSSTNDRDYKMDNNRENRGGGDGMKNKGKKNKGKKKGGGKKKGKR